MERFEKPLMSIIIFANFYLLQIIIMCFLNIGFSSLLVHEINMIFLLEV